MKLFLVSRKSFSPKSIFTPDWIFSFLFLALMTLFSGIAIADFLWGGHDPSFKSLPQDPLK